MVVVKVHVLLVASDNVESVVSSVVSDEEVEAIVTAVEVVVID